MQIQSERFGINNPKDFEIQADFTFYQISDIYNYLTRVIVYLVGLFIMTIGVSMSVKSNLGVSPVSSITYTITCITGLEMGKATILFHIVLVIIQIIILRKDFKIKTFYRYLLELYSVISQPFPITCFHLFHLRKIML